MRTLLCVIAILLSFNAFAEQEQVPLSMENGGDTVLPGNGLIIIQPKIFFVNHDERNLYLQEEWPWVEEVPGYHISDNLDTTRGTFLNNVTPRSKYKMYRDGPVLNRQERPVDRSFLMPIEDVFTIAGRGTVVTGRVERGQISVGGSIEVVGLNDEIISTTVSGIEIFRKAIDMAEAGDSVGLILRDVEKEELKRGQVIVEPESIEVKQKFKAEVNMLTKDQGGRATPFYTNYRPQFYLRCLLYTSPSPRDS